MYAHMSLSLYNGCAGKRAPSHCHYPLLPFLLVCVSFNLALIVILSRYMSLISSVLLLLSYVVFDLFLSASFFSLFPMSVSVSLSLFYLVVSLSLPPIL